MKTKNRVFLIGSLFATAGIFTALVSYYPSGVLQYLMIAISLFTGVSAIVISRSAAENLIRYKYYLWVGISLVFLSLALLLFGAQVMAFVNIVGGFLVFMGVMEFIFILQALNYRRRTPLKILSYKVLLSATSAIGSVWVLTMAGINMNIALFFLGVLLALIGLNFMQVSKITSNRPI